MDPGLRTPLVDFFRRGEVARDVKLLAAQGAFAPRALDQLALLLLLKDDSDPEVASSAGATLGRLPRPALEAFLGRSDVPPEMRNYFTGLGFTAGGVVEDAEAPLIDTSDALPDVPAAEEGDEAAAKTLANLGVMEKMKLATKGTREQRAVLVRDPNRLVAAAVLSSPKLTETEVEQFAKMANVAEDVLRVIGMNRAWTKNYGVILGLCRHPKTPPAISMSFVQRLNERDLKALATDRNAKDGLRLLAKKMLTKGKI